MISYTKIAISNPYNVLDYCLRINSPTHGDAYRLNNLSIIKGTYTFSVWVKSDSEANIAFNILGNLIPFSATTEWKKFTCTIESDGTCKYIDFIPAVIGINIYLYEGQLEDGTVATSWHTAEEDIPDDEYITQITKDTVTSAYIKALNLTVGNEIQMGSNARIAWSNVTGTDNIADKDYVNNKVSSAGGMTEDMVTQITKDTVTTTYVNSLGVTAKYINVSGNSTIAGWNIGSNKIYSGNSSTGVAMMRSPSSDSNYVFAAGGTSHSDYSDCPFRVTAGGKVYASRLYVTGDPNVDSGEGFYIYDPMNTKYLVFAKCNGGIEFPAFDYHFTGDLRIDKIGSDLSPADTGVYNIGSGSKYYNMLYITGIRIGSSPYSDSDGWISTLWKDGNSHQIVSRLADGLTASFGWYGTSEYKTVTQLRGQTVRYVNSSGTTTLSDERMKKDFTDLSVWEEFYSNTEPCAFKYIDGASGRYHVGFKAQQIQEALESSGLTTQDFAGFIQYDVDPLSEEWHGYDTEYGLIYTEFIALNTHMIQQLMKRVTLLENEINNLRG